MSRVAIVTGSNRGIGAAVARELASTGWTVITNGRSTRQGPGALHVRADVSTSAGARKLVAAARRRLDLLVNNVGDFRYTPVGRMDIEAWDAIFASNLRSAWLCCREALPLLRRSRGSVVNLGGPVTQTVRGNPRAAAYQMAKTALTVFTKSLAQAEAPRGLRVNMVNPGVIGARQPRSPAGRPGTPQEIARAVAWLASDQASYVNGAVLDVGGGLWV